MSWSVSLHLVKGHCSLVAPPLLKSMQFQAHLFNMLNRFGTVGRFIIQNFTVGLQRTFWYETCLTFVFYIYIQADEVVAQYDRRKPHPNNERLVDSFQQ